MKVLVTGSKGFLGRNLTVRINELKKHEVLEFHRGSSEDDLARFIAEADFIFHLAGVNRPKNEDEFKTGNYDLTKKLVDLMLENKRSTPIVFTSSTQVENANAYGNSKRDAEAELAKLPSGKVSIFRLPNVFGKWSRPNYNSVVATFCYNVARGIPIVINDPDASINLVYVDDVVTTFLSLMSGTMEGNGADREIFKEVQPVYRITVGELAKNIEAIKNSKVSLVTEPVGTGFLRALHATYLSFLPTTQFSYELPKYEDQRGIFVEMLKTKDSGQFSFFTVRPGVTRGGHYHHSKTEKFLVIKGQARYRFRNIISGETHEIVVDSSSGNPTVVETIPGWSHDITNIGSDELVVMLWANEIFDRQRPDTIAYEV